MRARVDIQACNKVGEVFPHTLICSIGGLGKTSLALAIADELQYHSVVTEAAALKSREQIIKRLIDAHEAAALARKPLLFFIDEIHRLSIVMQEVFYFPMDRENPKIATSEGIVYFKPFTLIAATTRRDELDEESFVKRFGNVWQIARYCQDDIVLLIHDWFKDQGIELNYICCRSIAARSLGIPRQALRLAEKVRNVFLADGAVSLQIRHCEQAFHMEGIDALGLNELAIGYLRVLEDSTSARGLGALAGRLGQKPEVIEGTLEPVLLELAFIDRVSHGRLITPKGIAHLERYHRKNP
jgi:Holliday junction DNA helicase RuvB